MKQTVLVMTKNFYSQKLLQKKKENKKNFFIYYLAAPWQTVDLF